MTYFNLDDLGTISKDLQKVRETYRFSEGRNLWHRNPYPHLKACICPQDSGLIHQNCARLPWGFLTGKVIHFCSLKPNSSYPGEILWKALVASFMTFSLTVKVTNGKISRCCSFLGLVFSLHFKNYLKGLKIKKKKELYIIFTIYAASTLYTISTYRVGSGSKRLPQN